MQTRMAFRVFAVVIGCLCTGAAVRVAAAEPISAPDERERRAVRGVPLEEALINESPELRELRRFEARTFSRSPGPPLPIRIYEPEDGRGADAANDDLKGRWSGSGDVPPVLRTPEHDREARKDSAEAQAAWLQTLKLPELPIRWHPSVLRYLEFFKSDERGRSIMASWVRRLGRYRAMFDAIADREGVPRDLIFLAMVESGFEPGAVSHAGAGGVWQFIPGAGRAYGLEVSYWVDNRREPERAAEAAARYLKDLYVRFGSWPLAFAAYNAGYGAVLKSISRYNTNDYWELIRHEAGLPWETSLYVPKILACAVVGHNLQVFGYDNVAMDPPVTYEVVEAPPGTGLDRVARAAGTTVEEVENLNPELIRGRTPPDRGPSLVRVPTGTGAAYAQNFLKVGGKTDQLESVVLRFGETLDDVAKARGVSARDLRKINGLKDTRELSGGTTILVPAAAAAPADALAAKTREASAPPVEEPILVAVPERAFSYEGRERVFYQTKATDQLEDVASAFEVSLENVVEWNNIDPDAKLQEGLILQLFVPSDFDKAGVALLDPARLQVVTLGSDEFLALRAAQTGKTRLSYKAKAGDTLAKIARRYGLRPADLARINRLSYNANLQDGQDVIVYSPSPELPREDVVGHTAPGARRPAASASSPATSRDKSDAKASKTDSKTSGKVSSPGSKTTAAATKPPTGKTPSKPPAKTAAVSKTSAKAPSPSSKTTAKKK